MQTTVIITKEGKFWKKNWRYEKIEIGPTEVQSPKSLQLDLWNKRILPSSAQSQAQSSAWGLLLWV